MTTYGLWTQIPALRDREQRARRAVVDTRVLRCPHCRKWMQGDYCETCDVLWAEQIPSDD